jgi:hypothetical protein
MKSGWSPNEKAVATRAIGRAKSAAEADILRLFRDYQVRQVEDLWKLEQLLQRWRRDIQGRFYFKYDSLEENLIEWIRKGWISLDDLSGFPEARYERIRSKIKKK